MTHHRYIYVDKDALEAATNPAWLAETEKELDEQLKQIFGKWGLKMEEEAREAASLDPMYYYRLLFRLGRVVHSIRINADEHLDLDVMTIDDLKNVKYRLLALQNDVKTACNLMLEVIPFIEGEEE